MLFLIYYETICKFIHKSLQNFTNIIDASRFLVFFYYGKWQIVKLSGLFRISYSFFEYTGIFAYHVRSTVVFCCCCHGNSIWYWLKGYTTVCHHYHHWSVDCLWFMARIVQVKNFSSRRFNFMHSVINNFYFLYHHHW